MTDKRPTIVLTGFMGAGKSTVAASLARQLNCPLVDLDQMIERREQRSVASLITDDGEARFREVETSALREVLESAEAKVIALGGGAWALERNRALIKEHGCVTVWLDASFQLCWMRITRELQRERPLGKTRSLTRRLYDVRRPLYELADVRVDVNSERSAARVAAEIITRLDDIFRDKG
jgi:shikimate kinase